MYHGDFSAVGLFVSDGRQAVPLNTADGRGNFFLKPNGVFVVTESGARVLESSEYPELRERVVLATQSGPLLVLAGKIHPAFKPDSASRHIRNGVGVPSPDTALFVISEAPVSFYDFATLFRDKLHSPDALFLDGTISSLYAPALKRSDSRADLGPIIAVAEASAPLGQVRKSGTSHPGSPRLWRFDPGLHSGASPRLFKAQRFSKRRLKRPPWSPG
ncbi:MAG TPA: phosphodiester glycosidase family protein [Thermoanaerobaculia bacterium]|nr:phosphodiester glycosidase family protein [Thermoanaerobaculia bacterium]